MTAPAPPWQFCAVRVEPRSPRSSASAWDEATVFWICETATPLEMPSWSAPTPGATRATTAVALAVPLLNGTAAASAPDARPQVPARRAVDARATIAVRPYPLAVVRLSVRRISTPPVRFAPWSRRPEP